MGTKNSEKRTAKEFMQIDLIDYCGCYGIFRYIWNIVYTTNGMNKVVLDTITQYELVELNPRNEKIKMLSLSISYEWINKQFEKLSAGEFKQGYRIYFESRLELIRKNLKVKPRVF